MSMSSSFGDVFGSLGSAVAQTAVSARQQAISGTDADPFMAALNLSLQTQQQALKAQREANDLAAAASVPQSDSESARSAADARRRKLTQGSNFGIGLPSLLGAPPVGFRMLSGE